MPNAARAKAKNRLARVTLGPHIDSKTIQNSRALGNEIAALVRRQRRSWAQVSWLLDQVERTEYWRGHAQSFSEWLGSTAPKIGVKESSLWRYLSTGRYYQKLRKALQARNLPSLPLEQLPDTISAEHLEILAKIERVVPKKLFKELAGRMLTESVTRNELRMIWRTYRPILAGRTARGRGVTTPRVDPADRTQLDMQRGATALTTLMAAGSEWTGIRDPQFYYTISGVIVPGFRKRAFDMLALVRETSDSPVMMIGVEIKNFLPAVRQQQEKETQNASQLLQGPTNVALSHTFVRPKVADGHALDLLAGYCDRLWVAWVGKEKTQGVVDVPEFVGILRVDGGSIEVERPAAEDYPGLGMGTGETAKELLLRLLRG